MVAVRAKAGARATSRPSQGRRRWVRVTQTAMTAAHTISIPALTIQ